MNRSLVRARAFSFGLLVAFVCGSASAQDASVSSAEANRLADEFLAKGKAYVLVKDLDKKIEAFKSAWGYKQRFDVACNLGNAEEQARLYRDAAEHLTYCLDNYPPSAPAQARDAMSAKLTAAKKHVARVRVRVSVDGADVLVDGKRVGRSPLLGELFLDVGDRVIEATMSGYEPARKTVPAVAAGSDEVSLTLRRIESQPIAPVASSTAPTSTASATPPPPNEPSKKNVPLIVTGFAVGGSALVIGAVTGVIAINKNAAADEEGDRLKQERGAGACGSSGCESVMSLQEQERTFVTVSFWSLLGGAAVTGATAVYALSGSGSSAGQQGRRASVAVMPAPGGIVIRGAW